MLCSRAFLITLARWLLSEREEGGKRQGELKNRNGVYKSQGSICTCVGSAFGINTNVSGFAPASRDPASRPGTVLQPEQQTHVVHISNKTLQSKPATATVGGAPTNTMLSGRGQA